MVDRLTYIRSKLKKTREPLKRVDLLNQLAWEIRYNLQEESKKCSEEALKISKEKDYPRGRAYARINLAVNHFLKSENREALELLRRSLKYFTRFENEKGLSITLAFTGYVFESFGDYETGLEYAQKALEKIRDRNAVSSSFNRIGRIYALKKEYDKALENYNKSLRIRKELNLFSALPWTYLGIASTYEEMDELEDARKYYKKN